MDGWRPVELKHLPLFAWEQRLAVLTLGRKFRRWTSAYYRVSAPSLRKYNPLDPSALRYPPGVYDVRLLSIYSQIYIVEASAWCRNHTGWLLETVRTTCFGGLQKRECLEAPWEAQEDLERAVNDGVPLIVTLSDYFKFFDSFDPRFYSQLIQDMGVHPQFARLFLDINVSSTRADQD